jgi:hypothetical protein
LFVLDACLSGLAGIQTKDAREVRLEQLAQSAHQLITAGTATEAVITSDRWKGSLFTDSFIRGATNEAPQSFGVVTLYSLIGYIQDRVAVEKTAVHYANTLTPQIRDLQAGNGAFFFSPKQVLLATPGGTQGQPALQSKGEDTASAPQGSDVPFQAPIPAKKIDASSSAVKNPVATPQIATASPTVSAIRTPSQYGAASWMFRTYASVCALQGTVDGKFPVALRFTKSDSTRVADLELTITLPLQEYSLVKSGSSQCDGVYLWPEGILKLGSRTNKASGAGSSAQNCLRPSLSPKDAAVASLDNELDMNLIFAKGESEIRQLTALLLSNGKADLTITKGPKAGKKIAIPLDGIAEALKGSTCSILNLVSYLPK